MIAPKPTAPVVGVGCQAGDGGDLPAVHLSEFGQAGDEGCGGGGGGGDAFHGGQHGGLVAQLRAAHEGEGGRVDMLDLLAEGGQYGLEAGAERVGVWQRGPSGPRYMPAMQAAQGRGEFLTFYNRLIGKGKKPLAALTAVMRKIIITLNARLKHASQQQS